MLEFLFYGILYIIVELFSKIMGVIDAWLLKPIREQKKYDETVQWFETHDFFDAMSPYIKEYLETGKLDQKFYEFDDELISLIGTGEGFITPLYQKEWKETILTYKKSLILNLKQGKDYYTSKGTIRVVKVHYSTKGLKIDWSKLPHRISPDRLQFTAEVPQSYINTLGYFGFTFIPGQTKDSGLRSDFEIVAYVNLGKNENS